MNPLNLALSLSGTAANIVGVLHIGRAEGKGNVLTARAWNARIRAKFS